MVALMVAAGRELAEAGRVWQRELPPVLQTALRTETRRELPKACWKAWLMAGRMEMAQEWVMPSWRQWDCTSVQRLAH